MVGCIEVGALESTRSVVLKHLDLIVLVLIICNKNCNLFFSMSANIVDLHFHGDMT